MHVCLHRSESESRENKEINVRNSLCVCSLHDARVMQYLLVYDSNKFELVAPFCVATYS